MTREEAEVILEDFRRTTLPNGRMPTVEDLLRACEQPAEAEPELLAYLSKRKKYKVGLEGICQLDFRPDYS